MDELTRETTSFLESLCSYPDRHPGRPGNRAGTELFARVAADAGLEVEVCELDCLDWKYGDAVLRTAGESFALKPGPYSNPCETEAPLVVASTIDELEALGRDGRAAGAILLVRDELCRQNLLPRSFPFLQIPEHTRILDALDAAKPAAIVAATGRNPELAGAAYPFPLIEDAEVETPNAYLTDVEGERLARHAGERVRIGIESRRIPARIQHVVARARGTSAGAGAGRIVIFGHVDSKFGTPGALDNATGAAALMALATLLRGYSGRHTVELVPLNGEDYWDATGEKRFVADNAGRWDDIVLGLNADAAGWIGHATEVSLYGCEPEMADTVRGVMARHPGFVEGEAWYQSDHGIFLLNGRPAVAVTSAGFAELCATVTHTSADTLDLVDPAVVAELARFYADVIGSI